MSDIVVGFDLDDTLVAEALFLRSGIRHIAHRLAERYPRLSASRITGCMDTAVMTRCNHYSALEEYLERTGMRQEIDMKEVVADFRSHYPDPDIYHMPPSTRLLLRRLKESGIHLALVTDGRSITQRNKIEAAGITRYINQEDIFISEETGHDKTHPDSFLAIMRKYAGAKEFHYVGDNPPKDFMHPSRLGWHTHAVHPFPLAVHQGIPR